MEENSSETDVQLAEKFSYSHSVVKKVTPDTENKGDVTGSKQCLTQNFFFCHIQGILEFPSVHQLVLGESFMWCALQWITVIDVCFKYHDVVSS